MQTRTKRPASPTNVTQLNSSSQIRMESVQRVQSTPIQMRRAKDVLLILARKFKFLQKVESAQIAPSLPIQILKEESVSLTLVMPTRSFSHQENARPVKSSPIQMPIQDPASSMLVTQLLTRFSKQPESAQSVKTIAIQMILERHVPLIPALRIRSWAQTENALNVDSLPIQMKKARTVLQIPVQKIKSLRRQASAQIVLNTPIQTKLGRRASLTPVWLKIMSSCLQLENVRSVRTILTQMILERHAKQTHAQRTRSWESMESVQTAMSFLTLMKKGSSVLLILVIQQQILSWTQQENVKHVKTTLAQEMMGKPALQIHALLQSTLFSQMEHASSVNHTLTLMRR